jgi:ribonucleotide reductase alpha subunit
VNLPHDATPEDVAHVYRLAHGLGTKGVTVFRYGSRHADLVSGFIEKGMQAEFAAQNVATPILC